MYKPALLIGVLILNGVLVSCGVNSGPVGGIEKMPKIEREIMLTNTAQALAKMPPAELYEKYVDLGTLEIIDYNALINRLKGVQVIYVAEEHTNKAHHALQMDILTSLSQKNPKTALAMEFLYRSKQTLSDYYTAGNFSDEVFNKATLASFTPEWYPMYSPLIRFAKANKLKLLALNVEKEIKSKMLQVGWDKLTPEEQKLIAKDIDTSNKAHKKFVMAQFQGMVASGRVPPTMLDRLYILQCMWDETFGEAIANYLKKKNDKDVQVVVVLGAGHVNYKFNAPDRSFKRYPAPFRTIVPFGVNDTKGMENDFRELLSSKIGDIVYFAPMSTPE